MTDLDVRDDAGWSSGDRINDLNQIMRQDITPAGGSTTSWTYSYDDNGRMTGKTDGTNTWTYTWDPDEPRLLRVEGPGGVDVAYTYDSAGRMLTRDDGTDFTTFEWDGWTCVKETTGSVVTRYIAPRGQIHSFERNGRVYQVHSDGHNGSVRAITDSTGAVVAHYEFDAWGSLLPSSSPLAGGFQYGFVGSCGIRLDSETTLHYMRNRWYDAGLGRFLSSDPIGLAGGLNSYAISSNSPVNRVDPTGLAPQDPWGGKNIWDALGELLSRKTALQVLDGFAQMLDTASTVVDLVPALVIHGSQATGVGTCSGGSGDGPLGPLEFAILMMAVLEGNISASSISKNARRYSANELRQSVTNEMIRDLPPGYVRSGKIRYTGRPFAGVGSPHNTPIRAQTLEGLNTEFPCSNPKGWQKWEGTAEFLDLHGNTEDIVLHWWENTAQPGVVIKMKFKNFAP